MAVYTVLDASELAPFIKRYGIGPLRDFAGVADGIENTTYFISTDQRHLGYEDSTAEVGHYVLTLFEQIDRDTLSFFCRFTRALANRGAPVAAAITDNDGQQVQQLLGKPALLVPRLPGTHPDKISPALAASMGEAVARVHNATKQIDLHRHSGRSAQWTLQVGPTLHERLNPTQQALLQQALAVTRQTLTDAHGLPQGLIHGDLFRDNVLADGDRVTGLIDFFSASDGPFLFDLAVIANDWCTRSSGQLDPARVEALLQGYQQQRPLSPEEHALWPAMLVVAALRFWLSRLIDQELRVSALHEPKDPAHFEHLLTLRLEPSSQQ